MTRRRTPLFATAALTLATALAASTALAIAESNDSMNSQSMSSTDARYPGANVNGPDQAVDSQSFNSSSDTDEDAMSSRDSSSDTDQGMDSDEDSSSGDPSSSSDNITSPDVDSSGASAAGISSTQASSTTLNSGSQIAEAPSDDATAVSGNAIVTRTRPVYIFAPDQPRYTPETGDAQYGSKLDPAGPSANRFNDATGQ
jgi:hypothetical protein